MIQIQNTFSPKMLRYFILILMFAGTSVFAKGNAVDVRSWSSEDGIQWFSDSSYKTDFFKLANHFESQNNKIYCGVASSVIVLNALRVRNGDKQGAKPLADSVLSDDDRAYVPQFSPFFERYTQDNVFTESAKSKLEILGKPLSQTKGGDKKRDIGLQLEQLRSLLASHDLDVKKIVADDSSKKGLKRFRKDLKRNLSNEDDYVLVNYTRKTLNQVGGGHISPIGAYYEPLDKVLIMDVNSNKADWVWVDLGVLYSSMATFDTLENRGYLLISEK